MEVHFLVDKERSERDVVVSAKAAGLTDPGVALRFGGALPRDVCLVVVRRLTVLVCFVVPT